MGGGGRGFWVVEIHCDNEIRAAMDQISALQSPPPRYVTEAQRNNRVISKNKYAHVIIAVLCTSFLNIDKVLCA